MSEDERSRAGHPILRHKAREREWQAPEEAGGYLEEVEAHLEKHVGKVESVFHEILSDLVHLDVLFIPAAGERDYHVLVTSGVADLPMKVPEGMEKLRRAELMICLPKAWPLNDEAFENESNYWPLRWLKRIGRLPHEYETWIGWGHTIPNGDPAEPIADTGFTGVLLHPPYWLPREFFQLAAKDGETLSFYVMMPLYKEELDLKLAKGTEELERRFKKANLGFVLDTRRTNVAKKKGWFW